MASIEPQEADATADDREQRRKGPSRNKIPFAGPRIRTIVPHRIAMIPGEGPMQTIMGAAIALSAILSSGAAQAQSQPKTFYMRQVIKNIKTAAASPAPTYTYTPAYGNYSTCSNGIRYSSMMSCTRSDGQQVSNSFCTSAGYPSTRSQSCVSPVTYVVHDHGYGMCENGQRPHYRDCLGSDGSEIYIRACSNYDSPMYESC